MKMVSKSKKVLIIVLKGKFNSNSSRAPLKIQPRCLQTSTPTAKLAHHVKLKICKINLTPISTNLITIINLQRKTHKDKVFTQQIRNHRDSPLTPQKAPYV